MKSLSLNIKPIKITRKIFSFPYIIFMMIFVLLPLFMIFVNAFLDADKNLTFDNFVTFFNSDSSLYILGNSIFVGIITTLICLVIAFPIAMILSKMSSGKIILLLFIMPMWINFLIRTLATKAIFEALNVELGLATVIFGMVYNFLPFMLLPLHTVISSIDKSYLEASQDMGATKFVTFTKIVLPMSMSGIFSGITMVFIPTISAFAISELLSNNMIFLFGDAIYMNFSHGHYGVGSIMSIIMILFVLISNLIMNKVNKNKTNMGRSLW